MIDSEIYNQGLVKYAIDRGGSIHPLIITSELTGGTGLMNPSVFVEDGRIIVNVRHVNYTLYHSEGRLFQHQYGPLQYLHPENDRTLRTTNFICELNENLSIKEVYKVDTSKLDQPPKWEFVGLEDARLVKWGGAILMSGVRRDTTTNGQGRIELSEIDATKKEIQRTRIPSPGQDDSYCEKNWMPVLDRQFTWVKWTNPTEIVSYDPITRKVQSEVKGDYKEVSHDLRGGSQVVRIGNYYYAICHDVDLFNSEVGSKDGIYRHRLVKWDTDFNLMSFSDRFDFMGANIEFCAGMAVLGENLLISFGFQDNAAFILKLPISIIL